MSTFLRFRIAGFHCRHTVLNEGTLVHGVVKYRTENYIFHVSTTKKNSTAQNENTKLVVHLSWRHSIPQQLCYHYMYVKHLHPSRSSLIPRLPCSLGMRLEQMTHAWLLAMTSHLSNSPPSSQLYISLRQEDQYVARPLISYVLVGRTHASRQQNSKQRKYKNYSVNQQGESRKRHLQPEMWVCFFEVALLRKGTQQTQSINPLGTVL